MSDHNKIIVTLADPRQAEIRALIESLDIYMLGLYPAESTHRVDATTLASQNARFFSAQLDGVVVGCGGIMLEKNYGRIINIASIAGKEGNPKMAPYSSTKAAVIGLTKSLGKELAETGIRVNCVTPAVVKTKLLEQVTKEVVDYMVEKIPTGRPGDVAEVVSTICWLASAECSFTNGVIFDVTGGRATY